MRFVGLLVGLCLLFAGAVPRRATHEHDRGDAEITTVKALAKLAARRHEGARPMRLALEPFALVAVDAARAAPCVCVEIVHASPSHRCITASITCEARGPPVG